MNELAKKVVDVVATKELGMISYLAKQVVNDPQQQINYLNMMYEMAVDNADKVRGYLGDELFIEMMGQFAE